MFALSSAPVAVSDGLTFSSVSAGDDHTCGVTGMGEAFCWGDNSSGQLGNGTFNSSSGVPVPVSDGHTFTSVSAGNTHTCGVTTSDETFCWGYNFFGQLGNGTCDTSFTPVRISAPDPNSSICGGGY